MSKKNKQTLGNVIEDGEIIVKQESSASIELKKNDRPYRIMGLLVLLITFGVLLGWAAMAPLTSAVVAPGRVEVASRIKVVQSPDGGQVKEILVTEGDIVEKDDVLLRMDDEDLLAQYEATQAQIWESLASQERLKAERDHKELQFSDELLAQAKQSSVLADILKTQKYLFTSGREVLTQSQEVLEQRISQAKKQITGNKNILLSLRKREALLAEDIASIKPLVAKELLPKNQLRDKQRVYNQIKGEIASRESDISRLKEVIAEQTQQKALERKRDLKEINSELRSLERRHIELIATKRRLEDKLSNIEIKAPAAGKVEKFDITVGAVISSGQIIMEIVPQDYQFSIVANVSLADIDILYVGQEAEVRLSSFDDARYFDVMHTQIVNIASDSTTDKTTGLSYYKTRLAVSDDIIQELKKNNVHLVSGMPAEVVIKTGERTVLDYLVKPITQMIDRAFNEK